MADPLTLALMVGGGLVQGIGEAQGQKFQAEQAERRAKAGRIQADQIDAAYRGDLAATLNNIRAIRATTGVGADSPTALAIRDRNTEISDRNRSRDVANRTMQADADEAEARFRRGAANFAIYGGLSNGLTRYFGS